MHRESGLVKYAVPGSFRQTVDDTMLQEVIKECGFGCEIGLWW